MALYSNQQGKGITPSHKKETTMTTQTTITREDLINAIAAGEYDIDFDYSLCEIQSLSIVTSFEYACYKISFNNAELDAVTTIQFDHADYDNRLQLNGENLNDEFFEGTPAEENWQAILRHVAENMERDMQNVITQANQARVDAIMNSDRMDEWIEGVGTNAYGGGTCYQLYLNLDNDSLLIHQEASSSSSDFGWFECTQTRLTKIAQYEDIDAEECEPYDDWEAHYRNELESEILEAIQ